MTPEFDSQVKFISCLLSFCTSWTVLTFDLSYLGQPMTLPVSSNVCTVLYTVGGLIIRCALLTLQNWNTSLWIWLIFPYSTIIMTSIRYFTLKCLLCVDIMNFIYNSLQKNMLTERILQHLPRIVEDRQVCCSCQLCILVTDVKLFFFFIFIPLLIRERMQYFWGFNTHRLYYGCWVFLWCPMIVTLFKKQHILESLVTCIIFPTVMRVSFGLLLWP